MTASSFQSRDLRLASEWELTHTRLAPLLEPDTLTGSWKLEAGS
jgi:hypothetical protein